MKRGLKLLILLFWLTPNLSFAQLSEIMTKAKSSYINNNYYDAIFYYELAAQEIEPDVKSLFETGMSQYHTNLYIPAERNLKNVIKSDSTSI